MSKVKVTVAIQAEYTMDAGRYRTETMDDIKKHFVDEQIQSMSVLLQTGVMEPVQVPASITVKQVTFYFNEAQ